MSYARQLLDTYPGTVNGDAALLASAIDALSDCAQACIADVNADLSEQNVTEMVTCIRLCLDCADVCTATIGVKACSRPTTLMSRGRCWRPAWRSARAAATSASGTPGCTSTAGSASRPAGSASRPAASFWPPWNRTLADPGTGGLCGPWSPGRAPHGDRGGFRLDRQVLQLAGAGDQVERGDAAACDREPDDRDGLVARAEQGTRLAIDQHRLGQVREPRRGGQDPAGDCAGAGDRRAGSGVAGPRSIRSTTSGSRTCSRASKSPPRAAARNASTTRRCRATSRSGCGAACTRRRARLASCRAESGVRSMIWATSSKGTANTSCSTKQSRSAGERVSSTTSKAMPTESASTASCSGRPGRHHRPAARVASCRDKPRGAPCGPAACPG